MQLYNSEMVKKTYRVYTTFEDITQQRNAEENLLKSEKRYRSLLIRWFKFCSSWDYTKRKWRPIDYCFLDINPEFVKLTGLKKEDVLGRIKGEVIPEILLIG